MKLRGYVGRREDTREIVETMLYEKDRTPKVLDWTHDQPKVRVEGEYLFEIDLGEGINPTSPLWDTVVYKALSKVLVTLVATGLTPEQKSEIRKHAPNFTLLE